MTDYSSVGNFLLKEGCLAFTAVMFEAVNKQPFRIAPHHRIICHKLDQVLRGEHPTNRLMFNIPPRHSKTELAVVSFSAIGFAINPRSEFMHLSSSDQLTTRNVTNIRRIMEDPNYRAFFPNVELSNNAKGSISTSSGGVMYAAPFMGQITGFGCGKLGAQEFSGAMSIDDPMKAQDSYSSTTKERIGELWTSTFKNRLNDVRTPVIVTAQRLAPDDFCGYLLQLEGMIEEGGEWDVVKFPAILDAGLPTERALWEDRFALDKLKRYQEADPFIFETQYMQNPKPLEGLMYREFRTYDVIPYSKDCTHKNYTDTADTGSDYLCSICYDELPEGNYVTDVLYTKKPMEYTEPKTAEMLARNRTEWANIESNNGGRGFARNVERILRQMNITHTTVSCFCQTDNKQVRIFTKSADVNNMTFFPTNWDKRWPEFYQAIMGYMKEGGNAHDDAPDALTGCFEKRSTPIQDDDLSDINIW